MFIRFQTQQPLNKMCASKWYCFFFFMWPTICGLKNVTIHIEPQIVRRGEDVTMTCTYDLENDSLYSVKWYRGNYEFFRYTPGENPSLKAFPIESIQMDLENSGQHHIFIKNVDFVLSANFICEVTTDAPRFLTLSSQQHLLVVAFPNDAPNIITEKTIYAVGDTLNAVCTSGPSRPATTLTLSVNNMLVCRQCETEKYPSGNLFVSKVSLVLPLFHRHFKDGQLKLRCSAHITNVYQRNADVVLKQVAVSSSTNTAPGYIQCYTRIVCIALLLFCIETYIDTIIIF